MVESGSPVRSIKQWLGVDCHGEPDEAMAQASRQASTCADFAQPEEEIADFTQRAASPKKEISTGLDCHGMPDQAMEQSMKDFADVPDIAGRLRKAAAEARPILQYDSERIEYLNATKNRSSTGSQYITGALGLVITPFALCELVEAL